MPRTGWASVACSCWFIAHRSQGRRRGVVSVPLQAGQANSGVWPAHGPQVLLPSGPAARSTWCWPQRGQFAGLARICRKQAPQTGPTGHHAMTGRAWPHDRHSCAGQVRQTMQTGGPSRVSHRPC